VTYDLTALGPAGECWLEAFDAGYQNEIAAWEGRNSRSARTAAMTCRDPSVGRASVLSTVPRTAPSFPGFRQSRTRRKVGGANERDGRPDAPGFPRRQDRRASSLLHLLNTGRGSRALLRAARREHGALAGRIDAPSRRWRRATMRWTQGPTRACSPRHARSAGAGRERRSFQTGYHTTPRYPIRPRLGTIRKSVNCWFPGFPLMARPGLEPGTPRFSVLRPNLSNWAESPAIKRLLVGSVKDAEVSYLRTFCAAVGYPDRSWYPIDADGLDVAQ
jgi:hypothetical protein